jgi:glycosyltransferase involved in cell wall biosynthesis
MSTLRDSSILIFSPATVGGVAEHTSYQGRALNSSGIAVLALVSDEFLAGRPLAFETRPVLLPPPSGNPGTWRKVKLAFQIVANFWILAEQVWKRRPALVLLDSYVEYASPFWVWPHWFLARFCGVVYAANLHDPVRDHQVGPAWWHRCSVRLAYLPLKFVLVHDALPEPSPVPPGIAVVEVPVGLYELGHASTDAESVRRGWGVTPGQKVFLAFGYVRDNKNLDLAIRALADVPGAFLVIAGSVASSHDRPFSHYIALATELGVSDRCHFSEGFIDDEQLGTLFAGADFVLLTYSATFHSQSGVLSIAARARKPVLASSGPGPLLESVREFTLGVTVEPDSLAAIVAGMKQLLAAPPVPRWDDYEEAASWSVNAKRILETAGIDVGQSATTRDALPVD